jgi:hypothetical protein
MKPKLKLQTLCRTFSMASDRPDGSLPKVFRTIEKGKNAMKNNVKKLVLNQETLRHLTQEEINKVEGGVLTAICTRTCPEVSICLICTA